MGVMVVVVAAVAAVLRAGGTGSTNLVEECVEQGRQKNDIEHQKHLKYSRANVATARERFGRMYDVKCKLLGGIVRTEHKARTKIKLVGWLVGRSVT